jgi:hypothetical protein
MTRMAGYTCRVTEWWPGTLVFSASPTAARPEDTQEWHGVLRDVLEYAIGGRSCALLTFSHDSRRTSLAWSLPGTFAVKKGKGALWVTPVESLSSELVSEIAESWEYTAGLLWIVVGRPAPGELGPAIEGVIAADRPGGERPETGVSTRPRRT